MSSAPHDLAAFLVEARRRTYAGLDDDATVAVPLLAGSKQLEHRAPPYPRLSAVARAFVELDRVWPRQQHAGAGKAGRTAADAPTPTGSASLQLAFKVSASEVDACADELVRQGVALLSPPTNQAFGHRTPFFRDPDGNLLEVYAEI